jgi:hypothetical protein
MIELGYADLQEDGSWQYEVVYKEHYICFDHVFYNKKGDIMEYQITGIFDEFGIPVQLNLSDIEIKIMLAGIELFHLKNK